jgi:hypothetical protein
MTRRIIVTSDPEAQQLETQMRLGEVGADTHDKAELMGATAVGTGGALELYSRGDHVHPVSLASGLNIAAISAATSTGGHTTVFCRADHQHYFDFATQVNEFAGTNAQLVYWSTSTGGTGSQISRADHQHQILKGVRTVEKNHWNTQYTNTGTGPMFIHIVTVVYTNDITAFLKVSGTVICEGVNTDTTQPVLLAGVINAGETYTLECAADTGAIPLWITYGF